MINLTSSTLRNIKKHIQNFSQHNENIISYSCFQKWIYFYFKVIRIMITPGFFNTSFRALLMRTVIFVLRGFEGRLLFPKWKTPSARHPSNLWLNVNVEDIDGAFSTTNERKDGLVETRGIKNSPLGVVELILLLECFFSFDCNFERKLSHWGGGIVQLWVAFALMQSRSPLPLSYNVLS